MNYWMNSIIPFGERSRRRANRGATNSQMMGLVGICGLGLGAGLMFMFDPIGAGVGARSRAIKWRMRRACSRARRAPHPAT